MTRTGRRRSAGQNVVEFALVAPIFFLMLLGVMELGRLVWMNHELTNGTREAARFAMVRGAESDQCGSATEEDLLTEIADSTVGLDENEIKIDYYTPFCQEPGEKWVIETSYDFDPMLGIIPGLDSLELTARSEVTVQH